MRYFFTNLSVHKKVAIIAVVSIVSITIVGIIAYNKTSNSGITTVNGSNNNYNLEEEIVPVIKEEIIQVSQDKTIDESLIEKEEDVIEVNDKKIAVPKSKVAAVNSAEDPEKNKKKGGEAVSQEQVNEMFQNVGTKSFGIDVSAHQGKINWAAVKAAGVDFAMIRCGFRGYSEGGIYEDAYFKTNVAGATANGIKVGIYFYSAAVNENEAIEEAVWVISKIKTYRITYPVVYDFEDFQRYRCINVDGGQATRNAHAFLNIISQAGYEPMMYANKSDITTRMSRGNFGCKFWLAHYTSQTDYAGSYQMWQYTSKGSVNGINGNVDMNIAYFSYGSTAAPHHTHDFSELVKNSEKKPTCTQDGSKTLRCACGDTEVQKIDKLGHKFGSWEITKAATETEDGEQVRICETCGEKETKVIEKTSKNTNTNTNTSNNTTVTNTSVENKTETPVTEPCKHNWVDDKIVEDATCNKPGSKVLKCTICNETNTKEIPATGKHNYGNGNSEKCTVCGESNPNYVADTSEENKVNE